MNKMTYNGYSARVEFDDQDEIFIGHIAGIRDNIGFHADNVRDLKTAFHEAVDDYIETCKKTGKEPHKPYSGKVMFRLAPEVHRNATIAAELQGLSLNQWAERVLGEASGGIGAEGELTASSSDSDLHEGKSQARERAGGKTKRGAAVPQAAARKARA